MLIRNHLSYPSRSKTSINQQIYFARRHLLTRNRLPMVRETLAASSMASPRVAALVRPIRPLLVPSLAFPSFRSSMDSGFPSVHSTSEAVSFATPSAALSEAPRDKFDCNEIIHGRFHVSQLLGEGTVCVFYLFEILKKVISF